MGKGVSVSERGAMLVEGLQIHLSTWELELSVFDENQES